MANIWNKNIGTKKRIFYSLIGICIILICFLAFKYFYLKEDNLNNYLILSICSVFMTLGIEFLVLLFNLNNQWVRFILAMFLGGFIVINIYNEYVRTGSILLIFSLLIFIIVIFTKNILSTLITFTVSSLPFFLIMYFCLKQFPTYDYSIFYLTLVLYFIFYRIIGVKLNIFFIRHCMGYNSEAQLYDSIQLKEQINFIYVVIFIILNLSKWFFNDNQIVASILNNAFITGVAITNINWHKIFWFIDNSNNSTN